MIYGFENNSKEDNTTEPDVEPMELHTEFDNLCRRVEQHIRIKKGYGNKIKANLHKPIHVALKSIEGMFDSVNNENESSNAKKKIKIGLLIRKWLSSKNIQMELNLRHEFAMIVAMDCLDIFVKSRGQTITEVEPMSIEFADQKAKNRIIGIGGRAIHEILKKNKFAGQESLIGIVKIMKSPGPKYNESFDYNYGDMSISSFFSVYDNGGLTYPTKELYPWIYHVFERIDCTSTIKSSWANEIVHDTDLQKWFLNIIHSIVSNKKLDMCPTKGEVDKVFFTFISKLINARCGSIKQFVLNNAQEKKKYNLRTSLGSDMVQSTNKNKYKIGERRQLDYDI